MQGGHGVGRGKQNLQHITLHFTGRNAHTISTRPLLLGMGKHHFLEAKRFPILRNKHLKQSIRHIIESGTRHLYEKGFELWRK